ncbi:MAG: type II secretion system F family protein [Microthrixaceae bacterium]
MIVVVIAVVVLLVARAGRDRAVRRRLAATRRAVPLLAHDLARAVRSGMSLTEALRTVRSADPAVARSLRSLRGDLDRGRSLDEAVGRWALPGDASLAPLAAACRFGHAQGGDPAPALDGVATALQDAVEVAEETDALVAQSRASTAALVALPPFGAAVFALVDPAVGSFLLRSRAGAVCLAVGVALDAAGAGTARLLVRRALR